MTNPRKRTTVRAIRPKTPQSVATAAASGDERALLTALRDTIASAITDGCAARDLASLSRRLLEVSRKLADVDVRRAQEVKPTRRSAVDESWREI